MNWITAAQASGFVLVAMGLIVCVVAFSEDWCDFVDYHVQSRPLFFVLVMSPYVLLVTIAAGLVVGIAS